VWYIAGNSASNISGKDIHQLKELKVDPKLVAKRSRRGAIYPVLPEITPGTHSKGGGGANAGGASDLREEPELRNRNTHAPDDPDRNSPDASSSASLVHS
jgi:hypothetical protein